MLLMMAPTMAVRIAPPPAPPITLVRMPFIAPAAAAGSTPIKLPRMAPPAKTADRAAENFGHLSHRRMPEGGADGFAADDACDDLSHELMVQGFP